MRNFQGSFVTYKRPFNSAFSNFMTLHLTSILQQGSSLKRVSLIKTRNAMCCNNRDDLFDLSFTLKISIFSEA